MIYVISDLHGYPHNRFLQLLKEAGFSQDDFLYILGDVVDRNGDGGVETLQWLMYQTNVQLILGNHEAMLLANAFVFDEITEEIEETMSDEKLDMLRRYYYDGGSVTLKAMQKLPKDTQQDILDYLRDCPLYELLSVSGNDYLLVHSGIEKFDKKVVHRTGDGNILAIEAGGCMEPVAHSRVMHDFDAGLMWDEPPYLIVNMNGERFIDEEVDMAYISNALRWQPGFKGENMDPEHQETGSIGWYCQIYDNDYMSYANGPVPDFVMARYLKEGPAEDHVSVFPELIDTFKADTIEELAEKLGLPVEKTVETFNRYNELCEKGEDEDFGKPAKYLHAFKTAPFWGIRRHIRCSSITAGVLSDEYGRVTTEDGEVIKGLYAVGNLGGQFYGAPDYPFFHPGLSLGHAVTFGYIAGEHAAQNR